MDSVSLLNHYLFLSFSIKITEGLLAIKIFDDVKLKSKLFPEVPGYDLPQPDDYKEGHS